MELCKAIEEFERYLDGYDRTDEKVNLKIVHTYGVMECSREIASRMHLPGEDVILAERIALLHDIGRFEQLKLYDSFLPETMDHAKYGAEILFQKGMIRKFSDDSSEDAIIETAIADHSAFCLPPIENERALLHARIIRDADKLDNCRVKLEENVEILVGASAETAGASAISPAVWESCLRRESVYSPDRKTPMDFWVSYLAYFYDVYFPETMQIVLEKNYIQKIIGRIPCGNADTREKMEILEQDLLEYARTKKVP